MGGSFGVLLNSVNGGLHDNINLFILQPQEYEKFSKNKPWFYLEGHKDALSGQYIQYEALDNQKIVLTY